MKVCVNSLFIYQTCSSLKRVIGYILCMDRTLSKKFVLKLYFYTMESFPIPVHIFDATSVSLNCCSFPFPVSAAAVPARLNSDSG